MKKLDLNQNLSELLTVISSKDATKINAGCSDCFGGQNYQGPIYIMPPQPPPSPMYICPPTLPEPSYILPPPPPGPFYILPKP